MVGCHNVKKHNIRVNGRELEHAFVAFAYSIFFRHVSDRGTLKLHAALTLLCITVRRFAHCLDQTNEKRLFIAVSFFYF